MNVHWCHLQGKKKKKKKKIAVLCKTKLSVRNEFEVMVYVALYIYIP